MRVGPSGALSSRPWHSAEGLHTRGRPTPHATCVGGLLLLVGQALPTLRRVVDANVVTVRHRVQVRAEQRPPGRVVGWRPPHGREGDLHQATPQHASAGTDAHVSRLGSRTGPSTALGLPHCTARGACERGLGAEAAPNGARV